MKTKLLALFCAAVLLLSGCGGGTTASTASTKTETPSETTTAPTEDPGFLEANGLTAWEGFEVEEHSYFREIHGTKTLTNGAEVFLVDGDPATTILKKDILETDVDVHITTYYPEEFGMAGIEHVVDGFYQLAAKETPELSKESWLAEHEGYVIYNCWDTTDVETGKWAEAYLAEHPCDYILWGWDPATILLDGNTGKLYYDSENSGTGKYQITCQEESAELYVAHNQQQANIIAEDSKYNDTKVIGNLYIMVPQGYDDLILLYDTYDDVISTDEELLEQIEDSRENETGDTWVQLTYQEYLEANSDKYFHYLPIPVSGEKDTRPAAGATFFDKMGLKISERFWLDEDSSGYGSMNTAYGGELLFFNSNTRSAWSYVDKAITRTDMYTNLCEYTSAQFSENDQVMEAVDFFYREAQNENSELTKNQWIDEHRDCKIITFSNRLDYYVSEQFTTFLRSHSGRHYWWIYTYNPMIMDRYTGQMFSPDRDHLEIVETFTIDSLGIELKAVYKRDSWTDGNFYDRPTIYVLAPADYDGLVFMQELYEENRSDDEILSLWDAAPSGGNDIILEEDFSTWWSGDYYEEKPYLKRYYFALDN